MTWWWIADVVLLLAVLPVVVYLLLVGVTWRRMLASRLHDPMLLYVGIYFLLAALQFRGGEALAWFVFGLQSGCSSLARTAEAA